MAIEKTLWISFDLGADGDYKGLYTWLDSLGAKECGTSLAVLKITVNGKAISSLKRDIKKKVKLKPEDRIYVIYNEGNNGTMKGDFLFGERKIALWLGYANNNLLPINKA